MFSFVAGIGTSVGGFLGKIIVAILFALLVRYLLCVVAFNGGMNISVAMLNIAMGATFLLTLFSGKK